MSREEEHKKWKQLPEEFRQNVVSYLQDVYVQSFWDGLKAEFEKSPEDWWAKDGWHFAQGMQIRNDLRKAGFGEYDQNHFENWDDYYIQALEEAAGLAP